MTSQDTLGSEMCRLARERLIDLAADCRSRGRSELARSIEDAATRGITEECATFLATVPTLAPANVDWDWMPNDWVVGGLDVEGRYLAYWTWFPVGESP